MAWQRVTDAHLKKLPSKRPSNLPASARPRGAFTCFSAEIFLVIHLRTWWTLLTLFRPYTLAFVVNYMKLEKLSSGLTCRLHSRVSLLLPSKAKDHSVHIHLDYILLLNSVTQSLLKESTLDEFNMRTPQTFSLPVLFGLQLEVINRLFFVPVSPDRHVKLLPLDDINS
jgi:hypothetical protein